MQNSSFQTGRGLIKTLSRKVYFERGSARGLRPQAQVSLLVIGFSMIGARSTIDINPYDFGNFNSSFSASYRHYNRCYMTLVK